MMLRAFTLVFLTAITSSSHITHVRSLSHFHSLGDDQVKSFSQVMQRCVRVTATASLMRTIMRMGPVKADPTEGADY